MAKKTPRNHLAVCVGAAGLLTIAGLFIGAASGTAIDSAFAQNVKATQKARPAPSLKPGDISGRYSRIIRAIYTTERQPDGDCPLGSFPTDILEQCSYEEDLPRDVFLRLNDDNTLDFGINLIFERDHSCTLYRRARPAHGHWRYEEKDSDTGALQCAMTITIEGDAIIMRTDENANCRNYCGARGSMDYMKLEQSLKVNPTPPLGELFDRNLVIDP